MPRKFTDDSGNPFVDGDSLPSMSIEEADRIGYGMPDLPTSGRIVAKPISIMAIWANPAQPRRAVPNSLQLYWNGNPDDVSELLAQWHSIACKMSGETIDIYAVLQGQGDGFDLDKRPAVFAEYVALLRLAASIHKEGLINPITVIEQSDRHLIESGERRWLAYHLLHQYMGADYAKVPASMTDGDNYIWRQATENTARRSLNAIGMARQLALLIMESRRGIDGQTYDSYEFMCPHGTCDRRYYAQVANGNVHKIPKGLGERIQGAMDLSKSQLSRYRSLLQLTDDKNVNDVLWIRADVEDWAEKHLRRISTITIADLQAILNRDEWSLKDLLLQEEKQAQVALGQPTTKSRLPYGNLPSQENPPKDAVNGRQEVPETWLGLEVETDSGFRGIVVSEHGADMVKVQEPSGQGFMMVARNQVNKISSNKADSVTLGDYYDSSRQGTSASPRQETSTPQQDTPSDDAKSADAPSQRFGKAVSALTGDKTPLLSEYWDGVLAGIATMAAVRGQANLVGRIQRLRSLKVGDVRNMDKEKLEGLLTKAYTGVHTLLAEVGNEYGELFAELDSQYFEETDDDEQ